MAGQQQSLADSHVSLEHALEHGALYRKILATLREREAALASLVPDAETDGSEPSPSPEQP